MNKDGSFTINNFQKGSALSPFLGFGKMINADIYSEPGIAKSSNALALFEDSNLISGTPTCFAVADGLSDGLGGVFVGTNTGYLYRITASGGLGSIQSGLTNVQDIVIYRDYLIITKSGGGVDTYGPFTSGAVYHSNVWYLSSSTAYHKIVIGQDDIIYLSDGQYVASITGSTFTGTAGTFNSQALDLPREREITTMCEYGTDLAIMTTGQDNARLYFWNRTGSTFQLPVIIPENTVYMMSTMNNRLYFVGYNSGSLYESNKTTYSRIWQVTDKLPYETTGAFPNAICVFSNQLLFGISNSGSFSTSVLYSAVYAYSPGYGVSIRNTISTGNYGQTNPLYIGCIADSGNGKTFYTGWKDNTNIGVDILDVVAWADAEIEDQFRMIGTYLFAKTFKTVEFNLSEYMPTGSSIELYYRRAKDQSFVLYNTYTASTYASKSSFTDKFAVADVDNLQIKVKLLADATHQSPKLLAVTFR